MTRPEFMRKVSELADQFHGCTLDEARDLLASLVITVGHRTKNHERFIESVVDLIGDGDDAEKVFVKVITQ
jgi:hypothetical protein